MHACQGQTILFGIVQDTFPCGSSCLLVYVKSRTNVGAEQLQGGAVHQVAYDEQTSDLEGGVARSVTDGIQGSYIARQHITEAEQVKPSLVCLHCLDDLSLSLLRHVHPAIIFHL